MKAVWIIILGLLTAGAFTGCSDEAMFNVNDVPSGVSVRIVKPDGVNALPDDFTAIIRVFHLEGETPIDDFVRSVRVINGEVSSSIVCPKDKEITIEISFVIDGIPFYGAAIVTLTGTEPRELSLELTSDLFAFVTRAPWTVHYDWGCDETVTEAVTTFASDYTFTTSEEKYGTWELNGNAIILHFSNNTTYNGTILGSSISGNMVDYNNLTGCWTAVR